jgi:hypothetical protein
MEKIGESCTVEVTLVSGGLALASGSPSLALSVDASSFADKH